MQIRPSAAIRNNYNEISSYCKETGQPVYLTKNGEGDLVVMDIHAYERKMNQLALEAELLRARHERLSGTAKYYTIEECMTMMDEVIEEAEKRHGRK